MRIGTAAVLLAGLLLQACGESSQPGPSEAPLPTSSAPGLPFHYEGRGESSSPTFHVDRDATYVVTYHLAGDPLQKSCLVSLSVISNMGEEKEIVTGVTISPQTTKDGTVPVALRAGDWRFQEAGGCVWTVTVGPPTP